MNLFNTNYDNPHGLVNNLNYSSAYDIGVLCMNCIKNKLFRKIVETQEYTSSIK